MIFWNKVSSAITQYDDTAPFGSLINGLKVISSSGHRLTASGKLPTSIVQAQSGAGMSMLAAHNPLPVDALNCNAVSKSMPSMRYRSLPSEVTVPCDAVNVADDDSTTACQVCKFSAHSALTNRISGEAMTSRLISANSSQPATGLESVYLTT